MKFFYLMAILIFSIFLIGCGIGGWYMQGDPYPEKPISELSRWKKNNDEEGQRMKDWLSCGGTNSGMVKLSSADRNLSRSEEIALADKEYDLAQACMINKGYIYIGKCRGPVSGRLACKKKL